MMAKIVNNISPLGYILGDEGSGAVLGKLLVGDCLKNQLTPELKEKFFNRFNLTPKEILDNVYKKPFPNRFLASVSPFLIENIEEPCIHRIVLNGFKNFFTRNVMQYDYKNVKVHFIGSIAYYYKEVLEKAALALQIELGTIIKVLWKDSSNFIQLYKNAYYGIRKNNRTTVSLRQPRKKSVLEILQDINTEDQKVALAVKKAIPQIEKLVSQIVPRMKQGGRIFYMGAGTSGRLRYSTLRKFPRHSVCPPTLVIGLIAGGDTALRNPVENAEDDMNRGWEELKEHNINEKTR